MKKLIVSLFSLLILQSGLVNANKLSDGSSRTPNLNNCPSPPDSMHPRHYLADMELLTRTGVINYGEDSKENVPSLKNVDWTEWTKSDFQLAIEGYSRVKTSRAVSNDPDLLKDVNLAIGNLECHQAFAKGPFNSNLALAHDTAENIPNEKK